MLNLFQITKTDAKKKETNNIKEESLGMSSLKIDYYLLLFL